MSTAIITKEPAKIIADIIVHELSLVATTDTTPGQVMLENQKFNITITRDLYIVVAYVTGKAVGNNNYFDSDTNEEVQTVSMNHIIQIDMMSYSGEARERKEEVIMALNSIYSQQQQALYGVGIARIPSDFVNASSLEASGRLNRFTMDISVKSVYVKRKSADYYNDFSGVTIQDEFQTNPTEVEL